MTPVMEKTHATDPDAAQSDLGRLLHLRVPVIVKLAGKKVNVEAISKITVGTIIEFETSAEDELELMIRSKPVGFGKAVKIGEHFGLRVSSMVDVHETISALGSEDDE